ncbi:MAG: hypothetical protein U9P79_07630 [Candidatus Cloacimonadota bacterium]|nr:hypothetical protein [Candidatus Cloacimonadota bacterium]
MAIIQKNSGKVQRFHFGSTNLILMIAALLCIIVGYIIVNSANNFGTILLVLGYVVFVPLSLLVHPAKD